MLAYWGTKFFRLIRKQCSCSRTFCLTIGRFPATKILPLDLYALTGISGIKKSWVCELDWGTIVPFVNRSQLKHGDVRSRDRSAYSPEAEQASIISIPLPPLLSCSLPSITARVTPRIIRGELPKKYKYFRGIIWMLFQEFGRLKLPDDIVSTTPSSAPEDAKVPTQPVADASPTCA